MSKNRLGYSGVETIFRNHCFITQSITNLSFMGAVRIQKMGKNVTSTFPKVKETYYLWTVNSSRFHGNGT